MTRPKSPHACQLQITIADSALQRSAQRPIRQVQFLFLGGDPKESMMKTAIAM